MFTIIYSNYIDFNTGNSKDIEIFSLSITNRYILC